MISSTRIGAVVPLVGFALGICLIASPALAQSISLSLDRAAFAPGESMQVAFSVPADEAPNSWIGMFPTSAPHGGAAASDAYDIQWQSVGGDKNGRVTFTAPSAPGAYELRMFSAAYGYEAAVLRFLVDAARAPAPAPSPAPSPTPAPSPGAGKLPPSTPAPAPAPQPSGAEQLAIDTWNRGLANNGPTAATTFTIYEAWLITAITNYHWNGGSGAPGGTIGLQDAGGRVYGPWSVRTTSGSGRPNVNWIANPGVVIPAGTYTVLDSDRSTWSHNSESGGRGFSDVRGTPVGAGTAPAPSPMPSPTPAPGPAPAPRPTPVPAPSPSPGGGAGGEWVLVRTEPSVGSFHREPPHPDLKYTIQAVEGNLHSHFRNRVNFSELGCGLTWEGDPALGGLSRLPAGHTLQLRLRLRLTQANNVNGSCSGWADLNTSRVDVGYARGGKDLFDEVLSVTTDGAVEAEGTGRVEVPRGKPGDELYLRISGGPGQVGAMFGFFYTYTWRDSGSAPAPVPTPSPADASFAGTWRTDYGTVTLSGAGTLTAAYDSGTLYLTRAGTRLSGYWVQENSGQQCAQAREGSYYWGRVTFTMQPDGRTLSGSWGYCDDDQGGGTWGGTREAGGPGQA